MSKSGVFSRLKRRKGLESDSEDEDLLESDEEHAAGSGQQLDDFVVDDEGYGYGETAAAELERDRMEGSRRKSKGKSALSKGKKGKVTIGDPFSMLKKRGKAKKDSSSNGRGGNGAMVGGFKAGAVPRSRFELLQKKRKRTAATTKAKASVTTKGKKAGRRQATMKAFTQSTKSTISAFSIGASKPRRVRGAKKAAVNTDDFMAGIMANMDTDDDGDAAMDGTTATERIDDGLLVAATTHTSARTRTTGRRAAAHLPPRKRQRVSVGTGHSKLTADTSMDELNTSISSMDVAAAAVSRTDDTVHGDEDLSLEMAGHFEDDDTELNAFGDEDSKSEALMHEDSESKKVASECMTSTTAETEMSSGIRIVEDAGVDFSAFPKKEAGYLNVFWIDMWEDPILRPGVVYVFGKVQASHSRPGAKTPKRSADADDWRSVCVVVRNIQRCMYFLPKLIHSGEGEDLCSEQKRVALGEVHKEVDAYRRKRHKTMRSFRSKPETMKFCFRERAEGVPAEAEYLRVRWPFTFQPPKPEKPGRTYQRVFGARTTAMEQLIVDCKLMGPSWIRVPFNKATIASENASLKKVSYCALEVHLSDGYDGDNLKVFSDNYPSPPLRVATLSMQTTLNAKKEHEIAALSWTVHYSVQTDGGHLTQESALPNEYRTVARKIEGNPWPHDLKQQLRLGQYDDRFLQLCDNERALLTFFLAQMVKLDADAIVGHKLVDFVMEIVIERMRHYKITNWAQIGRLRRRKFPLNYRGKLKLKEVANGRLLCDTFRSAQEFLGGEKTYTLSHLVNTLLRPAAAHCNYDASKVKHYWSEGESLAKLICHCANDAVLVSRLLFKLQILPLTKELTCLCGNIWRRSLDSQRAERNEYLLLHEFHKLGYIAPEKYSYSEKIERGIIEGRKATDGARKRGKAQYSGGLVLEPERGLYDKLVLLLDFNSLYPSVIQEFNLCFTTVQHWTHKDEDTKADEDQIQQLKPGSEVPTGLLPQVIGVLLSRRGAVKESLKRSKDEESSKRLDIEQKALKLVANSMYGCLGFSNSRFFCKPIAQMITSLGRASLRRAKRIAEGVNENLRVIYGDTDSIMVYTSTDDLKQANDFAREVKRKVNGTYKKMYLELDGVYSKMLLLRKKKYAALKIKESRFDKGSGKVEFSTELEVKGLDLVRRDWSLLSKRVGGEVLDLIMSMDSESVAAAIHSRLGEWRTQVEADKVALEMYAITKKLSKHPTKYPDAERQAHVQVAIRMEKLGIAVSVGDFIPYIVCTRTRDGELETANKNLAQRAYHCREITESQKSETEGERLQVDRNWYLSTQILPPVARYTDVIDGTDIGQLAHALGLDSSKFAHLARSRRSDQMHGGDSFDCDDELQCDFGERYKACAALRVTCAHCQSTFDFYGVVNFLAEGRSGMKCPTPGCRGLVLAAQRQEDVSRLKNSVYLQLRHFVQRYYAREYVCADETCGTRLSGALPMPAGECPQCGTQLVESYTSQQLLQQMRYFSVLFDVAKHESEFRTRVKKTKSLEWTLSDFERAVADELRAFIDDKFLKRNRHYFVATKSLFKCF